MDRKDWLMPLLAAAIGVMATLGGSLVAGYQHERAAARQAQLDFVKQQAAARAEEFNAFKHGLELHDSHRCVGESVGVFQCPRQTLGRSSCPCAKDQQRAGVDGR